MGQRSRSVPPGRCRFPAPSLAFVSRWRETSTRTESDRRRTLRSLAFVASPKMRIYHLLYANNNDLALFKQSPEKMVFLSRLLLDIICTDCFLPLILHIFLLFSIDTRRKSLHFSPGKNVSFDLLLVRIWRNLCVDCSSPSLVGEKRENVHTLLFTYSDWRLSFLSPVCSMEEKGRIRSNDFVSLLRASFRR